MDTIRLSDIAKEASVSVSAVTRYLNQTGYVSQEKGRAIEKAVKKLGYVPNRAAQALKSKQSFLIGHIVPTTYNNPYFSLLCEEVNRFALKNGYHVLTMVIDDVQKDLIPIVEQMRSRMVDGILLSSFMQAEMTDEMIIYLDSLTMPLVMVERSTECFGINKVLINNAEGTFMAANYLLDAGHDAIAYIGKAPIYSVEKERYAGFCMAMEKSGKSETSEERVILAQEHDVFMGFEAAEKLLQCKPLPTAVLIASDILAAGAMHCFSKHGLKIPEDLSIISHDNTLAPYLAPPLTSVCLPVKEMAQSAVELILNKSKGEEAGKSITISPYLVERGSVKKMK